MIWNRNKIAVLDILATAKGPLTVIEIAVLLTEFFGIDTHDDRVRKILSNLGEADLARHVGFTGRSHTWAITDLGREQLKVMAP